MPGEIETLDLIGDLPSNWKVARFGDVLEGGTRNGIYKTKEFHGSGAKVVNMGELFANPRLRDVPMKRVQLSDAELEKSCLNTGDLLFARRSLVAEGAGKCIVVAEVKEPTTFESSIIRARPNPNAVDSLFLYYLFNSPYGAYVLLTIRRQVAVSGITGTDLVELPIPLPPLAEQKAIAAVLGALDDKIELNRRMNATLEAMARALFQSWFVDFDPVRAKLDGRPPPPPSTPPPPPSSRLPSKTPSPVTFQKAGPSSPLAKSSIASAAARRAPPSRSIGKAARTTGRHRKTSPRSKRPSSSTPTASSPTPASPRFLRACCPPERCCFPPAPPSATSPLPPCP